MSLFVAIPSRLDISKGFSRLKFWKQNSEWIFVAGNGMAKKAAWDSSVESGLVLVSLAYLEQCPTPDAALQLVEKAAGVFIHPGGTDTPNFAHAERALQKVHADLRYKMLAKTVAFTRSGAGDHQVKPLTNIWKWMSNDAGDGSEDIIPGFDLTNIEREFGKLRGKQGRDAIARVCLLAQGSLDAEVTEAARSKFAEELKAFLNGEGSWLRREDQFGNTASALLESDVNKQTIENFLKAVRLRFGEKAD